MNFDKAFFDVQADMLYIAIRLIPQSTVTKIDGVVQDANGMYTLKVRITAIPEDGKANTMLMKYLAQTLHLPLKAITIISGGKIRKKILCINNVMPSLLEQLMVIQTTSQKVRHA